MAEILIVEDELSINELIRRNLSLTGHHCTQAFDGLSAATLLENGKFDLIVLDIMLPGINGFAVCSKIRETSNTHILIASAKVEKNEQLKGLNLGADDYIEKPYDVDILIAKINGIFKRFALSSLITRHIIPLQSLII